MKAFWTLLNLLCLTATIYFAVEALYQPFGPLGVPQTAYKDGMTSQSDAGSFKGADGQNHHSRSGGQLPGEGNRKDKRRSSFPLAHYKIITERNIFKAAIGDVSKKNNGPEEKEASFSDAVIASLEKTDLNVKLWGTVKGWDTENYAVIEDGKTKVQGLYKQGDTIEGTQAVIRKVLRMSVVLNHNGKDQVLEMAEEAVAGRNNGSASPRPDKKGTSRAGEDRVEMTIQRSLIDESMSDINTLMKQARVRPHFTGGKADGLLLYGLKQSSIFKKMGIRNGDIIMGVDGKDIRSVEDAISLYDSLKNASEANIEIKRRGKTKEFIYHVE